MNEDRLAELILLQELSRRPRGFGVAHVWVFDDCGLFRRHFRAAASRLGLETCTKPKSSLLWWRYPANVIPFVPVRMPPQARRTSHLNGALHDRHRGHSDSW